MQGIYINGQRPRSKRAVREAVAANPSSVRVEATSMFGNEPDCLVSDLIDSGKPAKVAFVGPNPYNDRRFYGTLTVTANGTVTVK